MYHLLQKTLILIAVCAISHSAVFSQEDTVGNRSLKVNEKEKANTPAGIAYALVYGVSEYKNLDPNSQLRYADNDAWDFYNLLLTTKLVPDSNNIYRKIDAEATASNFFADFDKILKRLKEGDKLIVYFAGHGDVEKNGVDAGYLLGASSEGVPYAARGTIDLDMLQRYVNAAVKKKTKVVLITDACRPGDLPGGNEGRFATRDYIESNFLGNNIVKIISCGQGELSKESRFPSAGGHGVFTYFLLEALQGMCVTPNKENITLRDVEKYLTDSVAKYTSDKQNPVILGTKTEIILKTDTILRASIVAQRSRILSQNDVAFRTVEKKSYTISHDDSVLYIKFYEQLKQGQLNKPSGNNAYETYKITEKTSINKDVLYDMKLDLAARLEDAVQPLLNKFIRGEFQDYPDSLFAEANNKLKIVQVDLMDSTDFRYNEIKAKRIFFIASVSKTIRKLELLKTADVLMPNTAFINFEIGRYFSELNQSDSALYYLNKTIFLSPRWSFPRFMIGNIYLSNTEYTRAQTFFAQAINLQPNFAYALSNLGLTFKALKQKDSADYYHQKAVLLDSSLEKYWGGNRKSENNQLEIATLGKAIRNTDINEEEMFAGLLPPDLKLPIQSSSTEARDGYAFYSKAYYFNKDGKVDSARYWYNKAIEMFEKANNAKTMPFSYYYTWGYAYQSLGNYAKAKDIYFLALKTDTTDQDLYQFGIGWIVDKEGQTEEAMNWYKKAFTYNPSYYQASNNIGWAYARMKNTDSAVHYYRQTLQIKPDFTTTITNLANIYFDSFKDDSAIYYYKKLSQLLAKPDAFTYNRIGISYNYLGNYDSAIIYYNKAIRANDQVSAFFTNLGDAYFNSKQYASAIQYYEKGNNLLPDSTKTYFNLAFSYASQANYKKAEEIYKQSLLKQKNNPNIYLTYYNLGWTLDKQKKLDESLIWYTKTVKVKPDYLNGLNNMGYTYDRLGKQDSAVYWYKQALKINPVFKLSLSNLAYLYNDMYKYDSSLYYYKLLLPLSPADASVRYEIAQLYYYDANYDSAIVYYEKAIKLNKTKADYQTKAGDAYFDATATPKYQNSPVYYQKAIELYSEALRLDSTQFLAMNRLGVSYIYLGKYTEGIAVFKLALQKDAVYKNTYEYNLACIYSLQKEIDNALNYFDKSINSGYRDLAHMSEDTDLDNIRSLPAFKKIIEKYFKPDEINKNPELYKKKN